MRIQNINTTEAELLSLWRTVNNNGCGFATESEDLSEARKQFRSVVEISPDGSFVGIDESNAVIVFPTSYPTSGGVVTHKDNS